MINISPVGRNASVQERIDYEKYDAQHQIRSKLVAALKEKFPEYGLTYVLFCFPLSHPCSSSSSSSSYGPLNLFTTT